LSSCSRRPGRIKMKWLRPALCEHRHCQDGGALAGSNDVIVQLNVRWTKVSGTRHWHRYHVLRNRVLLGKCDSSDLHHGRRQHGQCVHKLRMRMERNPRKLTDRAEPIRRVLLSILGHILLLSADHSCDWRVAIYSVLDLLTS
jgi:hypothetical protein